VADNTTLNSTSGGDTIRDIARTSNSPAKTQVVALDLGGASDSNAEVIMAAASYVSGVASQPSGGQYMPTLHAKDSGRTPVCFFADRVAGVTAEALLTLTINKGGSTSSATSYTVSAGKTLRVISFAGACVNSTTTANSGRLRLRSAATVATTSPIFASLDMPGVGAAAQEGQNEAAAYADGIEFAAGTEVGVSYVMNATTGSISVCVVGFEY
jgi:hypothetical protein